MKGEIIFSSLSYIIFVERKKPLKNLFFEEVKTNLFKLKAAYWLLVRKTTAQNVMFRRPTMVACMSS